MGAEPGEDEARAWLAMSAITYYSEHTITYVSATC